LYKLQSILALFRASQWRWKIDLAKYVLHFSISNMELKLKNIVTIGASKDYTKWIPKKSQFEDCTIKTIPC